MPPAKPTRSLQSSPAQPTPTRDAPVRTAPRNTATFEPYFWDAYNEIVEPRRFDHYLVQRWLPALGPVGFAVVKALRDRCYHNPTTGVLRDTYEADMDELGRSIGLSRATVFREFNRNPALGVFVRKIEQYQMVGGRPQQTKNLYQVCMDDPIHPNDRERYEALRVQKEAEREQPIPTKIIKPEAKPAYESQIATHKASYESQIATPYTVSQSETANTVSQSETAISILLPSELLTKESLTPAAGIPPTQVSPPEGVGEGLVRAWQQALQTLSQTVNVPTLQTHILTLRPLSLSDEGEVTLGVPHAFTREWIEKRHGSHIETALTAALDRPVTLRLILMNKESAVNDRGCARP